MKRFGLGFLLAVCLLVGYWAWPFVGLHSIAADLQARDAAALSEHVDFTRLRRSLAEQIIATYLQITGRASKLGVYGNAVATAVGVSIADPLVSQIINPENLIALLNGRTLATDRGPVSLDMGQLPAGSFHSAWETWLFSDYRIDRFSVAIPLDAAPADQYRLRLQLLQWHWKLVGIDLPEKLRIQFAQQLAKTNP